MDRTQTEAADPRKYGCLRAGRSLLMLVLLFRAIGAIAGVTVWDGTSNLSYTDLFDVSQGTVVVDNSPVSSDSSILSAIGYDNPNAVNTEGAYTYFADGLPAGTIDYLTIKTLAPVNVGGFNLFTYDDSWSGVSNANRGFTTYTLLGSMNGTDFTALASGTMMNSYLAGYGSPSIEISATFAGVADQYFTLQLSQYNTTGVRVVEFDGLAPVPELPTSMLLVTGLLITSIRVSRNSGMRRTRGSS